MVNQLGEFSPHISEIGQPLRELLSPKCSWLWGPRQQEAFDAVKTELSKPTVLALYNPEARSKVSADASSFAINRLRSVMLAGGFISRIADVLAGSALIPCWSIT